MTFSDKIALGRTGLMAGRLGIASGYGAPSQALEEAFERGCNYFTWGTFIKGRSAEMKKAINNIVAGGKRDDLILAMFTYAHSACLTEKYFYKGLKDAGVDHADVLLLGYFSSRPRQSIIDGALKLKEQGRIRFLGLSSHNRKVFPLLAEEGLFDVFHLRYNAAHRGAETEIFPHLSATGRPGTVAFTATRWRQLLDPRKMPPGEKPATAGDCYRFVLTHPGVDLCMAGARTIEEMRANLQILQSGPMNEEELAWMRRIGDHLHRH
jgi:predicted aldo/keto reductase-like oxidoreductase